jgi:hypothetical protein
MNANPDRCDRCGGSPHLFTDEQCIPKEIIPMNPADLVPGFYRISSPVPKHPGIDRRVNSDWRKMPLPEGGRLLCIVRREIDRSDDTFSLRVELRPYSGLAGQQYGSIHAVPAGWRTAEGKFTESDGGYHGEVLPSLLKVLVRDEIRDCDDALALWSSQERELSWREIALYLLSTHATFLPTEAVFRDAAAQIAKQDDLAGDDWKAQEALDSAWSAETYRPQK